MVPSQQSFTEHCGLHCISDMLVEPVYHLKQVKHHARDGCIASWSWCWLLVMLMLSGMLSLFMVWTAPGLGNVRFNLFGFLGGMVVFYGFHNWFHGRALFRSLFLPCYYFWWSLCLLFFHLLLWFSGLVWELVWELVLVLLLNQVFDGGGPPLHQCLLLHLGVVVKYPCSGCCLHFSLLLLMLMEW